MKISENTWRYKKQHGSYNIKETGNLKEFHNNGMKGPRTNFFS